MGNATTKFQSKKKKNRTEPKREPQDRKLEKNENFKTVHKELRKKHKETNQFCEVTNDINVQLEKYSQITKKNSEGEEVIVKSIKKKQNVDYETETRLIELYKMPASAVPVNEIFQNISQFNKNDGASIGSNSSSSKMGASSNPNAARLATLQERKKTIEETLAKRNQELKQLCVQEAELTGIMPPEIPLEPGESPPSFRRRIGTSFQLPQNLINNLGNEEESISKLELEMQIQAKLADAAFLLADERNISKTVRRQHKLQYEKHKKEHEAIQEKLQFLKARAQRTQSVASQNNIQQKQKKKPRPLEKDDTVSMHTNLSEPLGKSTLRHSMRSLQHPMISDSSAEQRDYTKYRPTYASGNTHANPISPYLTNSMSMFYRLSLNDYKNYVERRESAETTENLVSQQPYLQYSQHMYSPQSNSQYNTISHSPNHLLQRSTIQNNYTNSHDRLYSKFQQQIIQDCMKPKINMAHINSTPPIGQIQRQSSGSSLSNHKAYYPPQTPQSYRQYNNEQYHTLNPNQLQPHQQYEHVMTSGLGGIWKQSETGELVWCNTLPNIESPWQNDKMCGSLDRRRNKRLHKKASPSVEAKVEPSQIYNEQIRTLPSKPQALIRRQDKLVRTQSLGSVGAQTVDGVWPSDDNSSCEIDMHNYDANSVLRKPKQKVWYESSLDGPTTSQTPIPTTSILAPEEKYSSPPPMQNASPVTPKAVLEIPAESNPSSRIQETNIEIFNNNIPKNCTIVLAGQWKPYHEETKPFEMSDFYKYSTKFKKVNKPETEPQNYNRNWTPNQNRPGFIQILSPHKSPSPINVQENVDDDTSSVVQKGIYQPLQPMKCQPFSPVNNSPHDGNMIKTHAIGSPGSLNTSLDLNQITSNVAENFSAEMNAWYQNHEHQMDNNNTTVPASKIRSTATLV